jgi:curved DNA-binding protein CbpA
MTGIDELNHYELLEIPRTANTAEVERAYRLLQQTYGEESLALYSVFEGNDAAAIREQLDEACRVLSDPELRAAYDEVRPTGNQALFSTPLVETEDEPLRSDVPTEETAIGSFDQVVEEYNAFEDVGEGEFDGLRLRRTRLFRGYEIDDISDVTKVSRTHLRNIEDENFIDLPADVYVRGFVTAYARTIGLDPKIVVPSYMERVQESRSGNERGRFLGRR